MKILTVEFCDNGYTSGCCIEIEETEGFQKVFSTQSAKDSLKGMAD
jgi:hypothetical protein